MSLTEKLLALDAKKYKEKQTADVEIKRLSELIGEPFIVKVQEVDSERMQEIQAMLFDKKGRPDMSQARKVNTLIVLEGVIEPNLKDENLQKHFGAATPKELAAVLFKGDELTNVANEIAIISGYAIDEEEEEEQKN
jgi:hypothetical protein